VFPADKGSPLILSDKFIHTVKWTIDIIEMFIMKISNTFTTESSHWQAVNQRNPDSDGMFVYGVVTTGIYCRPVCPSRMPKRENVRFFDTHQMAEEAGFRPCKRCTPQNKTAPNTALDAVTKACKIIDTSEKAPTLNQLAVEVGLSPYYFHRLFKRTIGITPKQYAMEKRKERMRTNLHQDPSVTDAIYNAGYESGSRFYEKASTSLGMKPSEFQKGGEGLSIRYSLVQSYLGWVLVAVTDRGVCQIDIDDSPEILKMRLGNNFPNARLQVEESKLSKMIEQTLAFLEVPKQNFTVPLDIQGTAFQQRVWNALQDIQPGTTASYGDIAKKIGNPKGARAVAQACASNNIAVVIPCHRVVRKNGDLGGYRWGIERKQKILKHESQNTK
jgi:AraC family transcriptional regulator of adaptative response/methylated-DNA-[protein]-cysteine methyltransferase